MKYDFHILIFMVKHVFWLKDYVDFQPQTEIHIVLSIIHLMVLVYNLTFSDLPLSAIEHAHVFSVWQVILESDRFRANVYCMECFWRSLSY
jgi:hypothetical protein